MSHSDTMSMEPLRARATVLTFLPAWVAVALFVAVTSLLLYRSSLGGLELRDFRDAVYYPIISLLDGNNPYDTASYFRTYPVEQEFPPYLPHLLTLHLPFGLLPFNIAQVLYFVMTAALTVVLAVATLRACDLPASAAHAFGLATLLIMSRPGYWNIAMGQVSVPVAIGTYWALRYADERIWWAAWGLAIALCKPTYGVPLSVLLLAQGATPVIIRGALIAAGLAAVPTLALLYSAGGPLRFAAAITESYLNFEADPSAGAATSPDRVDAVSVVARTLGHSPTTAATLLIAAIIIGTTALAVWSLSGTRDRNLRTLSDSVACLGILTFAYHQAYDLVLLALPLTALATGMALPPGGLRRIALAALALPMINYVSTRIGLSYLAMNSPWRVLLLSINGIALLIALCSLLAYSARRRDANLSLLHAA